MARSVVDLNQLKPARAAKGYDWEKRSRGASSGATKAHLGDIAGPLEEFLRGSEAVVGCVAWITSRRLVAALSGTPVSIIVNKEWNLRSSDTKPQSANHRELFAQLSGGLHRSDFPAPLNQVAGAADDTIDAVRCAGHIGRGQMNSPLMHHKFAVRLQGGKAVAVWTGSFNFTHNAESSFENAIEVHDPVIAQAYLEEWARVAALSEPMDFAAGKADPSWSTPRPTAELSAARTADRPVKRQPPAKRSVASAPAAAAKKPRAKAPAKTAAKTATKTAAKRAPAKRTPAKPKAAAPAARTTPKARATPRKRAAPARQRTSRSAT